MRGKEWPCTFYYLESLAFPSLNFISEEHRKAIFPM
jgi:hypothetical protein